MAGSLIGRWDLVVSSASESYPSWLEVGDGVGRFVGRVGSARPLREVSVHDERIHFSLPPQYEARKDDLVFEGRLEGGVLKGTTTAEDGSDLTWRGTPAPELPIYEPRWGSTISLIGEDLSNWIPRETKSKNNWSIANGALVNGAVGADLVTRSRFKDFRLLAEYRYPTGSNSGIYLRGRYEMQIFDDYGAKPSVGSSAAIYGFLTPSKNAILPAGEWNRAEITLIGRHVAIVLNGEEVVRGEIPGITGGALDSDEGTPGPLFLQGDHGPVTFRRLDLTPAE